jgi:hypothetical protein
MWSVLPPLPHQPFPEMVPDAPERARMYLDSDAPQSSQVQPRIRSYGAFSPLTFSAIHSGVAACHGLMQFGNGVHFRIELGDTYALEVRGFTWDPATQGVNGKDVVVGPSTGDFFGNSVFSCIEAKLVADEAEQASAITQWPFPVDNAFVNDDYAYGVAVSCGYAFDGSPQLRMYAHLALHGIVPGQSTQNGPIVSFGSGTISLVADCDTEVAHQGTFRVRVLESSASWRAVSLALRYGQFTSTLPFLPERNNARTARFGTRVASLRSRATNFLQPANTRNVALIDCGGHSEFSGGNRLAPVTLDGQPDADVAWIAQSNAWRSNCGFTTQQNQNLSRLGLVCANLFIVRFQRFGVRASFEIEDCEPNAAGNNEYAGFYEQQVETTVVFDVFGGGVTFDKMRAFIGIAGFEDANNSNATTLNDLSVAISFVVRVVVFAVKDGIVDSVSLTKTLNETEADSFFGGQPLVFEQPDIAPGTPGGTVTLTAIG